MITPLIDESSIACYNSPIAYALALRLACLSPGTSTDVMRVPDRTHTTWIEVDVLRAHSSLPTSTRSRDVVNLAIVLVARQEATCDPALERLLREWSIEQGQVPPVPLFEVRCEIRSEQLVRDGFVAVLGIRSGRG